eukprot:581652-Amphidinium_carterae.1
MAQQGSQSRNMSSRADGNCWLRRESGWLRMYLVVSWRSSVPVPVCFESEMMLRKWSCEWVAVVGGKRKRRMSESKAAVMSTKNQEQDARVSTACATNWFCTSNGESMAKLNRHVAVARRQQWGG